MWLAENWERMAGRESRRWWKSSPSSGWHLDPSKHLQDDENKNLRYEMQTNKPIVPLVDSLPCSKAWNAYLAAFEESEGTVAWFSSSWMLTECYMYRRSASSG